MIPMTTQQLGHQPGRARLGACGHRNAVAAHRTRRGNGCASGSWHLSALGSAVIPTTVTTMSYAVTNPTGGEGFGSTKRPARHLGTRST
jgi:hypothetical protein